MRYPRGIQPFIISTPSILLLLFVLCGTAPMYLRFAVDFHHGKEKGRSAECTQTFSHNRHFLIVFTGFGIVEKLDSNVVRPLHEISTV
jgi:hypothetical protein